MTYLKFFLCLLISAGFNVSKAAENNILFEGYSKIQSAGVHVGYTVSRYEFNSSKKRFKATSFIRTGQLGADIMESLIAECDEKFGPISYQYTSVVGKDIKTIDAKFKRSKGKKPIQMTAVVKEGAKSKTIKKDLDEGTFLSSFLVYLMLQSKQGIQTNANYQYKAIAEEDAEVYSGEARVDKQEKYSGIDTFKITNNFKNVTFTSFVTDKGEVIATKSPAVSIATELVAKSNEALGSMSLNSSLLKTLFNGVPLGQENILARRLATEEKPVVIPPNPKKEGVEPGQGIVIKGGNTKPVEEAPKEQ